MKKAFEIGFTQAVQTVQEQQGSRRAYAAQALMSPADDRLGSDESGFIAERDGFYQATVSETGWPYMQFRGGLPGFVHVIDDKTLAYADLRGNRQYMSVGNLSANDKILLFFMDYAEQQRLKVWGRAQVSQDASLLKRLTPSGEKAERAIVIKVEAFDWNCPKHIPQRFTISEIQELMAPLHARIAELEKALL